MRRAGTNKLQSRQVCGIAAGRGQIRLDHSLGALQCSGRRCALSVPAQEDGIRTGNKPAVENAAARPAAHSVDPEPLIDGGRGKAFPDVCGAVILPANAEIKRKVSADLPIVFRKSGHFIGDDRAENIGTRDDALPLSFLNIWKESIQYATVMRLSEPDKR